MFPKIYFVLEATPGELNSIMWIKKDHQIRRYNKTNKNCIEILSVEIYYLN